MAFQHVGSHGRVFNGLEARAAEEDNKMRFIHNRPGGEAKKENKVAGDGKTHVIHHNNGLVHDLGLAKNEAEVADGKKHVFHKNHGLVHDLGLAQKQEVKVDGDKGKKHVFHSNKGLIHDLGLAQKQEIEAGDGKKHVFHTNHGLIHDLGLSNKQEIEVGDGKKHIIHNNHGLVHDLGLADKAAVVETVYSQVYVTESKTFDGPAQYVTVTGTQSSPTANSLNSAEAAYASAKSAANAPEQGNASSAPVVAAAAAVTSSTAVAASSYQTTPPQFTRTNTDSIVKGTPKTTSRTAGASVIGGTPLSQQHTGENLSASSKDTGMTAGAKAGVAFGVIFALALCGGLIFFCWRRRKQQQDRAGAEKLDEKHTSQASFFSGTAAAVGAPAGNLRRSVQSVQSLTAHTAATAPRLSLRPVTQFLPNIMGGSSNNAEANRNGPQMSEKPKSAWERKPVGSGPNPFDDAAVIDEKNARQVSPLNPFEEGDGAAAAVAGKKSPSHSSKGSWEGSEPPTPKSTKFGTAAAVPIGAAGAAKQPPAGPNNVHRVQLDFKPSMDDELELKSGQIVRMLHEYDDGWCLCIRMDRSQQGVCPRTCLSKLPVKPRAPGGPPPPGQQGRPRGPPPPGMQRPQSPAMRDNMVPRPLTPTGRERSQTGPRNSPAPQDGNRNRSQSVSSAGDRPASPAGMPTRKPVPGQAL